MKPLLFSVGIPTRLAIFWRRHLARTARMPKTTGSPKSIIVFRLDQLGDLVLTTPLFRELRRNFPNARCTVVVHPDQPVAPPPPARLAVLEIVGHDRPGICVVVLLDAAAAPAIRHCDFTPVGRG